ncbi:response regulator [Paenibacillus thalictri]|uniref:response regulator n=1 Tax=Paenibacillus thalictri TaxID=2527873 RepID=UPI0013EF2AC1|nr:response regulator [Paenibacillus thalictri]
MWKVILVDDEAFIRSSVRQFVPWATYGFEVIGEASAGRQALTMIRERRPDLVLADIIMPGMNGIELLEQVRSAGINAKFVMLTCVNEFEYARKAVELGASGYVLKLSMDEEAMGDMLRKVGGQLAASKQLEASSAKYDMHVWYAKLWRDFHSMPPVDTAYMRVPEAVAKWQNEFPYVTIAYYPYGGHEAKAQREMISVSSQEVVSHLFADGPSVTVFHWGKSMAALVSYERYPADTAPETVSLAVPSAELPSCWLSMLQKFQAGWYGLKEESQPQLRIPAETDWQIERRLLLEFELGRSDACAATLKTIGNMWRKNGVLWREVKAAGERLDQSFRHIAAAAVDGDTDLVDREWLAPSHHDLFMNALEARMLRYLLRRTEKELPGPGKEHDVISRAIVHIRSNLGQTLTAKQVAKTVSLDEDYLSTLFKKKTGVTLIQYIHQSRIDQARRYLEQTDMSVREIGETVGFENTNYFHKIFKRMTGLTPQLYRQQNVDSTVPN